MNKTIILNNREIAYVLERKKVKNINLRIRSDSSVYVSASDEIADEIIEEFLCRKANYILAAIDKYTELLKYSQWNHGYVTGESFRYLGKELRLVVVQGENHIESDGVYIYMSVSDKNDISLKKFLVDKWYDARSKEVFMEIISEIYPVFQKYRVPMPKVTLRNMSSRWGSCQSERGIITLNKRLIETPRIAIEYVVMHEFIHFIHPNHSTNFYEMLSTIMPDWQLRKKLLES